MTQQRAEFVVLAPVAGLLACSKEPDCTDVTSLTPAESKARDDANFLKHSLAHYEGKSAPRVDYLDVVITKSRPGVRDYSGH